MPITAGIALIVVLTAATAYFVAVDRSKPRRLADDGDPAAERAPRVSARLSFMLSGEPGVGPRYNRQ